MCARKSKAACGACEIAQYADGRGARNQRVEKDLKATHPPDAKCRENATEIAVAPQ